MMLGLVAVAGCTGDGQAHDQGAPTTTAFAAGAMTTGANTTARVPAPPTTVVPQAPKAGEHEVLCDLPASEPGEGEVVVTVYEICHEGTGTGDRTLAGLQPVERLVPASDDPLSTALEALLAGPTPEEDAAGLGSSFSTATAQALIDAAVGPDSVAVVDLDRESIAGIDNVSATTAGEYFRAQLYGTVFEIEEVSAVRISLDGSSSGFCAMMELVPECVPVTRSQWEEIYSETIES